VHNPVRVEEGDAEGASKLAGYMLRAPMALEKMAYDTGTGTVIYRSKLHLGLKRNFQVMPGAEWLLVTNGADDIQHAPEAMSADNISGRSRSHRPQGQLRVHFDRAQVLHGNCGI